MARIFQQRLASSTLAAALLVAIAAPVLAQPAPPAPDAVQAGQPEAKGPRDARGPRHHRGPSPEQFKEHMAQRAAQLKQKLQITPAQEPAWTSFTTAMQPPADRGHARLDHRSAEPLTTPERIDRMRALRAQRSAEMDRRDEAVKTFYAALSPAQQKVFDTESRRLHRDHRADGPRGPQGGKPGAGPRGEHGPRGAGTTPPAPPATQQ